MCLYRGSSPRQGERVVIVAICDSDPVCVQVSTNVYERGGCMCNTFQNWAIALHFLLTLYS